MSLADGQPLLLSPHAGRKAQPISKPGPPWSKGQKLHASVTRMPGDAAKQATGWLMPVNFTAWRACAVSEWASLRLRCAAVLRCACNAHVLRLPDPY